MRIGRIKVCEEMIYEFWKKGVPKFGFIPIEIKFDYPNKTFEYIGYCDYFDDVHEGACFKTYLPEFKKDKLGRIRFIQMS